MLLPLVVVVDFSKRERASERLNVDGQGDGCGRTLRLISLIALVKEGMIGTFTFTMDVFVLASILALRQQIKYCCPGGDNEYSQYSGCHCHCGLRFTGRYLLTEDVDGGGGVEAHALLSLSPKKGRWHLFPSLTSLSLLPLSQTGERPRFSPKVTFPASPPPSTHTVQSGTHSQMKWAAK